jgi:hypothetical protein
MTFFLQQTMHIITFILHIIPINESIRKPNHYSTDECSFTEKIFSFYKVVGEFFYFLMNKENNLDQMKFSLLTN